VSHERRLRRSACLLAALFLAACGGSGAPFNGSIDEDGLREDLTFLASPEMRGRLVGSAEIGEASEWVRDRFDSLGLVPAGDGDSFFQDFYLTWFSLGEPNALTVGGTALDAGDGWSPINVSVTARGAGDVVFAGFGIVEPRLDWDDYGGADLAGKVLLVLAGEPGADDPASPFDGLVTAEASREWRKIVSAQEHGAAAVLFVRAGSDVEDWAGLHGALWPSERRRVERFTLSAWTNRIRIPAALISNELARRLVSGSGRSLEELAAESGDATNGLGVVELPGARVALETTIERHATAARNILAMVEGSDPELRDEVVIVGAHLDHDGADGDVVYAGADDDGSGTVGVLAIAGAYARAAERGERPRRTVLFAVWDAEERGLLGAWYYTVAPRFPLESTVANLNMDMIGRNEEVPEDGGGRFRGLSPQPADSNANATNLLGYSRTPELAATIEAANRYGLVIRERYDNNESNLLRRSDHWPFLQNGVPAVWFHTGLHPDYHRAGDTPDRIEYGKMTRIVRLVHQASWDLANADGRPALEGMRSRPPS